MADKVEELRKDHAGTREKEPYTMPHLESHGDVGKITKDIRATGSDGFAGSVIDR